MIRSADGGATWSAPVIVSPLRLAEVTIAGQDVRTSDVLPEFSVDRATGTLYAIWQDGRFSPTGASKIGFSPAPRPYDRANGSHRADIP